MVSLCGQIWAEILSVLDIFSYLEKSWAIWKHACDKNWRHSEELCTQKPYWRNKIRCISKWFDNLSTELFKTISRSNKTTQGNITSLFIIMNKPFKVPSKDTLVRWVKQTLKDAGINMNIFSPHSTRSTSNNKAKTYVPLKTILETGEWRSNRTFARFYDKPIL